MTHRHSLAGALLLALVAFASPALAQTGKLTGLVTDQQTGQPIPGAQITLEPSGRATLTAENGRYFLLNVPPGIYTVRAEVLGYTVVQRENVQVSIDVTSTLDFALPSQALEVREIVVEAERVPLVPQGQTGSVDMITTQDIEALPVTDIIGVLTLEPGFIHVPVDNTDVVSYAQQRQGVTALRIRGGRGSETQVLIDGIPINNFVLGGPAFDISNMAIRQVQVSRGWMDAQYGNALSGVINYATREGGPEFEGELNYRSSAVGGWLGSGYDETRDWDMLEGFVSGPVPGTGQRLRFMVSGRQQFGAGRAYEFDNDVFDPSNPSSADNQPHALDVIPGWRAAGYDGTRDAYSKLTFLANPAAKLSLSWATYRRENQNFDFDWMLAVNPLDYMKTAQDSAYYLARPGNLNYQNLVPASTHQRRDLFIARWDHTLGRSAYQITAGYFDQKRTTCNFMSGVCLEDHFEDPNFSGGFVAPGPQPYRNSPTAGTDYFWGGEHLKTVTGRFDIQSQVSDHHNLSAGVFYSRHDLTYDEWENKGNDDIRKVRQFYQEQPWDGAVYLQDQIEYDFITVKLGMRLDYGKAAGQFFANPVDPTNGTNALDVCANPQQWQNKRVKIVQEVDGVRQVTTETRSADPTWTAQSCGDLGIRGQAAILATADDFAEAEARFQFSPRIGVNVPVTENSSLFFNFGRYSQNPILRNLYQNTGIGTPVEGTTAGPAIFSSQYRVPFLGNSHLNTEQSTSYEVGYSQNINETYAVQAIAYSKDQSGLTGLVNVGSGPYAVTDPGVTYGTSTPSYYITINQDFATTRGFEISLRRRVQDYWGFNLQYSFSRCTTNAADPEREFEALDDEGDDPLREEITCEIDQPHSFSGVLRFGVGDDVPEIPFGSLLRETNFSVVTRYASGTPYTPTTDFNGFAATSQFERYSAYGPASFTIDLHASKGWRIGNISYGVFLNVNNLLDRKNCVQVFTTTGECSGGAEDQSRRRAGNTVGTNTNSTFFDRPQYFGRPRSIDAGLRIRF